MYLFVFNSTIIKFKFNCPLNSFLSFFKSLNYRLNSEFLQLQKKKKTIVGRHDFKRDLFTTNYVDYWRGLILTFETYSNNNNCLGHMVYVSIRHP